MQWLNFFSIKQKLASLLFFLLSAVSYLVISTISDANQHKQSNTKIEVAQQQHLIVEQFINAFFFARQQANISGEKHNNSEIKKNQFLFEKNLKSMLYGGKTYSDFTIKSSLFHEAITNENIRADIKESLTLWKDLQSASQSVPLQSITLEQLTIFHHLSDKLQKKLSTIVNSLTVQRDNNQQQDLLILKISWLFILIIGSLLAWLIARNIIQPLDGIAQAASRIRLGDLQSYPINDTHHDELGTLLYQADEMRVVLSELIQNIQQHHKQIVQSSMQADQLSDEMNSLHHLQYDEHQNVVIQLNSLQQQNKEQLKLLAQHADFNHINLKTVNDYKQCRQLASENIKALQQSNNVNSEILTSVHQHARQLYDVLANIEEVATKTEALARKATIDATHAGRHSEQFTLVANQVAHLSAKTANNIAAVSPLIGKFRAQLNVLSRSSTQTNEQLNGAQQQFLQSNDLIGSLHNHIEQQQQYSINLKQKNEQQALQIDNTHAVLESVLHLIRESSEKTEASNLCVKDLKKISVQLEQLSHDFKLDEKENRTRRGNDKRLYPRIDNQLKISLQQDDKILQGLTQDLSLSGLQLKSMKSVVFNPRNPVTFYISLPGDEASNDVQPLNLLGDVVHYEQQGDIFYYGAHFHPLSDQQKKTLQEIFNYFEKKSEFKH